MSKRIQTFSQRLNEAMSIRDMKQVDLIQATGIKKQKISQYVNGLFEAKQEALYLLAKTLDVSESWLMGYDVPIEREPRTMVHEIPDELKGVAVGFHDGAFDGLDEDDVEMLKAMAEHLRTKKRNTNEKDKQREG